MITLSQFQSRSTNTRIDERFSGERSLSHDVTIVAKPFQDVEFPSLGTNMHIS